MSIQILGLRSFIPKDSKDGKPKTYDAFHEKYWRETSVHSLFKNLDKTLAKIPKKDQWNIFYTIANCKDGKREFESLGTLAFDIDGLEEGTEEKHIDTILPILGLSRDSVGIVSSGHGLHFLIRLAKPFTGKEAFKELKPHYKNICTQINKACSDAGLGGRADSSIFEPRRLLRLPGTINRKKDKPDVVARLIQPNMKTCSFSIKDLSKLPDVKSKEQVNVKILAKFPRVDTQAIIEGCNFIKNFKDDPNSMSEEQWYAALSITGRMNDETDKDGYEWSHEFSKGYNGYDPDETDQKLEQALEASGPRTCENINQLWSGCANCPNVNKVSSPILIRGEDTIPTEFTGFHNQPFTAKGKPTPNCQDLVRFFEREFTFKGLDASGMVHVWDGKHYKYFKSLKLGEFAEKHYDPPANINMRREFSEKVKNTNLFDMDWWDKTTCKINFNNGYLDIKTMNFMPHDPDIGFRYVLPYDYSPNATSPSFEKMLNMITGGDKAKKDVLLEYMGYCLSNDDCWTQKALVMVGDGANGKSTLLNVLRELAGKNSKSVKGNYSSFSMKQLNDSEYNRQNLDGKLFNICEETPTQAMMDNSLFKSLATGDEIQVRAPYKDPYFITNTAKLIFSANELPTTQDNTYGYWRRVIVVPFSETFTRDTEGYDPHIGIKLTKELSGIFNMVIEGYQRLVKNQKFTDCSAIDAALADYKNDNDSVLRWYEEKVTVHTNGGYDQYFEPTQDLYTNYKYQAEAEGVKPVSKMKFCKSMSKLIPNYSERSKTKTVNKAKVRCIQGVSVQEFH